MPQAVPAIIIAAGQAVAGVAIAKIAIAFVINVALSYLSEALADKPRDPGRPPVNVTVNDTVDYRHLVVGTRRVGGSFVDIRTSGGGPTSPNKFLWYVIAYADHQCSALRDAWFDEFYVPEADIDSGTGAVSTTWANGKAWIWNHLGTQAQTADAQLTGTFGSGGGGFGTWTSTDRLRGVCYRVIKMERDDTAFPSGAPNGVSALVDGALVYDMRKDTTNGGSGSHRMDDPSTWEFSESNWALGTLWLLTGGSVVNDQATRLVKYGIQEEYSRIDWPFWAAVANVSDQTLTGANTTPAGDQARYTLDMEVTTAQLRKEHLDLAIRAGAGEMVYVHGKWRLHAGAYDAPVHSFDQDDLRGEMEIEDTTDEKERVNRVAAIYVDPDQQWKEQTTPYRFNAAYDTQDQGRELPKEIDLRAVTNAARAQRICELELRKARQMRRVVFRFGRKGMKVAPHETFTFSHSRLGWVDREFRCVKRKRERTQEGGIITVITARTEDASIYTDLLTADYATGTTVTNSIQSEAPEPATALTASARPGAIDFAWTLGAFWTLNGISELWEATTDSFGSATKIWEGRGTRLTLGKSDSITRYYWHRMRTIGGQTSATFPTTNGVPGNALLSAAGWQVDAAGKPVGIRGVESIADRSQLSLAGIGIRIASTPDTDVGYGFPAIPIDDSATYSLTIRHKSSASSADGLYLRMNEYNAALPAGVTHIGSGGEPNILVARTQAVDLVNDGPMPGTTVIESTYSYTPTAGTKFMTFDMRVAGPTAAGVNYDVEWVRLTRTGSDVNLLSTGGPTIGNEGLLPDAATDPFEIDEPADGNVVFTAGAQPRIEVGGIGGDVTYTSPANRDTEVRVSWGTQAAISNTTSGTAVGTSTVRVSVTVNAVLVWEKSMIIESYNGTDEWASFSGTRDMTVPAGQEIRVRLSSGRVFDTGGASPAQTHFWQNAFINLKAAKA